MLRETLLPNCDQTYSAFIEDLDARGLLDETLVVTMGEMGRTPKINKDGGRDHWTYCYSVLLAGAGIRGGTIHGASDEQAALHQRQARSYPRHLRDEFTICWVIDPEMTVLDRANRPIAIAHGGRARGRDPGLSSRIGKLSPAAQLSVLARRRPVTSAGATGDSVLAQMRIARENAHLCGRLRTGALRYEGVTCGRFAARQRFFAREGTRPMERTPLSVAPAHTSEAALTPRRNWLLVVALVLGVAAAGAEFYVCVARYNNDFLWHRIQGQTFLNRTLYEQSGLHYLPARAMIDSVTAWLPYRVDRALWLAAACAGLVWCTRFWSRLGRPTAATSWVPAAVVLALMGGYLHRDFAECGLQLALLIILTAAFAALLAGKQWLSGLSLGLAVVYKVTPILFLPYLIWKRQWRAAGWMVASIALWCALPAVHLGWQKNTELHGKWYQNTMHLLTLDDPSENGVELPNRQTTRCVVPRAFSARLSG